MIPKFPFYKQHGEFDCGVACLQMVMDYYGKPITHDYLLSQIQPNQEGVTLKAISDLSNSLGLKTMGVKVDYNKLVNEIPTPCIAFWREQHFIIIYHVNEEYIWIADPASRGIYVQTKESFQEGWIVDSKNQCGVLLLFEPTPEFHQTHSEMFDVEALSTL